MSQTPELQAPPYFPTTQEKINNMISEYNSSHLADANTMLMDSGLYEHMYLEGDFVLPKGFRIFVTNRTGRSESSVTHIEKEVNNER